MNEPMEVAFAPDRLAVLLRHFAELNDQRESWRVAYPLKEVLLLVTCAMIATCDDFDEIVLWGQRHPLAARFDEPDRSVNLDSLPWIRPAGRARVSAAATAKGSAPCILARRQHDHRAARFHPAIQIDDIFVGHADAA